MKKTSKKVNKDLKVNTHKLEHNEVLDCVKYDNVFYVSYNPFAGKQEEAVLYGEIMSEMTGNKEFTERQGETALVFRKSEGLFGKEYYILNGDFREEYKKLIPKGYKACKKFFDSMKEEHGSVWSM